MEDLKSLDINTLVDLLVKHTNEYMKMLKEGATDNEYSNCKTIIQELTKEIETRQLKKLNSSKSGSRNSNIK